MGSGAGLPARTVVDVNLGLRFRRPTTADLRRRLEAERGARLTYAPVGLSSADGAPPGFRRDRRVRRLGCGDETFAAAVDAIRAWRVQRGAGLVVCVDGPPEVGVVVASSAPLPVGHTDAVCRVVTVVDQPDRIGFAYGTLPTHPARGEESFVVVRNGDGTVDFEVTAVSTPRHPLARLCPPVARRLQRRAADRYPEAMAVAVRGDSGRAA
jgi:uncharacterized protein (UPF0548 family)